MKTCSFIGYDIINVTNEMLQNLSKLIEDLIINHNVKTFIFGFDNEFSEICYDFVNKLKKTYPYIQRVCLRDFFPYAKKCFCNNFKNFYKFYEDMLIEVSFPTKYTYCNLKRSIELENKSDICVFYCEYDYLPLKIATTKSKIIYNLYKKNP